MIVIFCKKINLYRSFSVIKNNFSHVLIGDSRQEKNFTPKDESEKPYYPEYLIINVIFDNIDDLTIVVV